jgi:exodeoxyribonuclease V beta subunit
MSPLQVLDRLVREFGYFDEDLNVLKLLEFASKQKDIPTLVEEFASSSIAVASNTVHGAKIMTIHGSKGLEFEYVILLDKVTGKKPDSTALLYHYDERLHIEKILYRMAKRENFDDDYARIVEAKKISSEKDSMNVLYVALTRAVEGLIVIRKEKKSIFDALRMEVMTLGELRQAQLTNSSSVPELGEGVEGKVLITNYGMQETMKQEEEEEKDYEAILFGTALHYGLEMLGTFDETSVSVAMTALQNKFGQQLSLLQLEEIQKRISSLITNQEFQNLLQGAKVSKEQSLSYEGQLKQIDLLLEYEEKCMVIDYKSSKKYAEKHKKQVSFYQKAIEKITQKPTSGAIVYLLEDEISVLILN